VRDGAFDKVLYSLVPSMLPPDDTLGQHSLDRTIGHVASGQSEVGVQYRIGYVPPDLWPTLLLWCGVWLVPETCTRTSAVLQWGGQRGLLSLDTEHRYLTLVCRSSAPVELRVRFHWALVELVTRKYPFLPQDEWLHAVCHVCHHSSQLFGRALRDFWTGGSFSCSHDDVELAVEDLVQPPATVLDATLAVSTSVASQEDAARLCGLAARMVDTAADLCGRHRYRPQLWLPVSTSRRGPGAWTFSEVGVGVGVGAGSGAASGSSDDDDELLGWVSVCEDPAGWHVACDPVVEDRVGLTPVVFTSVRPLLRRVAMVLCAVQPLQALTAGLGTSVREWVPAACKALLGESDSVGYGRQAANWLEFVTALKDAGYRADVLHSRATELRRKHGRCQWMCPEHKLGPVPAPEVSVRAVS
jgi:hypothetical protein